MSATTTGTTTFELPAEFFAVDYDKKDAAEGRADAKGQEPCYRCGRGIKPNSGYRIEIVAGGGQVCTPGEADVADPGYCGTYPIGSECGKFVPAAFRVRNTDDQ